MQKRRRNIVDYVTQCGGDDFWRRSFNDVDSLVLSTLCYADLSLTPFGKMANFNCTVRELDELVDAGKLTEKMWNAIRGERLLRVAANSRRFGDVLIHHYRRVIDELSQEQFAAVTFSMNTDSGYVDYIAFQGTDDTLLGWKEDFNMAFASNLPSQREALNYTKYIASLSDNKLILGGHSKGGNLATYAGLKSPRHLKSRIVAVFDHDGPGFLPGVFTALEKVGMAGKVYKTIPESAFFGLLLESYPSKYKVVKSDGRAILQHDSLTWQVDGGQFLLANNVTSASSMAARSIRRWLRNVTPEQRQAFIDALYEVLSSMHRTTAPGIKHYVRTHKREIVSKIRSSDPQVRKMLVDVMKVLAKSSVKELAVSAKTRLFK